eukprot:CAMPEP_0174238240 /NCGR_PEP_ID=MMETSP0417-20130205/10644_1 /TAXON_ID=242541 /ORGANISM="Mayorella sp, Strain BSH-02190019" /LENGTH=355 /DNA_ID=CAMNT_0015317057 /DNA_START=213 /DNA_END=1277 /DNA_ORIENTATION=-
MFADSSQPIKGKRSRAKKQPSRPIQGSKRRKELATDASAGFPLALPSVPIDCTGISSASFTEVAEAAVAAATIAAAATTATATAATTTTITSNTSGQKRARRSRPLKKDPDNPLLGKCSTRAPNMPPLPAHIAGHLPAVDPDSSSPALRSTTNSINSTTAAPLSFCSSSSSSSSSSHLVNDQPKLLCHSEMDCDAETDAAAVAVASMMSGCAHNATDTTSAADADEKDLEAYCFEFLQNEPIIDSSLATMDESIAPLPTLTGQNLSSPNSAFLDVFRKNAAAMLDRQQQETVTGSAPLYMVDFQPSEDDIRVQERRARNAAAQRRRRSKQTEAERRAELDRNNERRRLAYAIKRV